MKRKYFNYNNTTYSLEASNVSKQSTIYSTWLYEQVTVLQEESHYKIPQRLNHQGLITLTSPMT